MRLLLLSDVHANLAALDAVLAHARARGFDRAIFLGDALGYGPQPAEVLAVLGELGAVCVQGNHDLWATRLSRGQEVALAPDGVVAQAIRWQLTRLSGQDVAWVASWPEGQDEGWDGEIIRFRHGSPGSVLTYVNSLAAAREAFTEWDGRVCAVGHTHLPAVYASVRAPVGDWVKHQSLSDGGSFPVPPGARVVLNPGSVGQPRDGDPRASYGLYDTTRGLFEVRRVTYDVARTQKAVAAAGLPDVLAARLGVGK